MTHKKYPNTTLFSVKLTTCIIIAVYPLKIHPIQMIAISKVITQELENQVSFN